MTSATSVIDKRCDLSEENGEERDANFAEFLKQFLSGEQGIEAAKLAAAAGLPNDPAALASLMAQLQAAISSSSSAPGVNWDLAAKQARGIAASGSKPIDSHARKQISDALSVASLWLDQATEISPLATEPKLLTREVWVEDAMPLFKQLAQPVADRMSEALAETMQTNAPEELAQMVGSASSFLKSAGGALFAMQIGQAIGRLSQEVISGGDLGLTLFQEQRVAFVPQNLEAFIANLELEPDQGYIYLAVRELAHSRLFKHSKWLREHVVNQVVRYASEIAIDNERIQNLATEFDPNDSDALRGALESGAFLAERTESQNLALDHIETMLALIEGWVDVVTEDSTRLLPKASALAEAVRRRRATGGPAEKTFGILVGLQLRPRKLREATAMWRAITEELGAQRRDDLWNHPDLLPTATDIENPVALIERLKSAGSGDDFDRELRNLLDD